MEVLSKKISKFLNSEGLEKSVEAAFIQVMPEGVSDIKTFISKWQVGTFKAEMNNFTLKMANTGLMTPSDITNFQNIMEDYYLICDVTPGIILLLKGMFLFYISELEKVGASLKIIDTVRLWEEVYKIAILNISWSPREWIGETPKKCIPWRPEFSKYDLSEERFSSFILFVEKTLQ